MALASTAANIAFTDGAGAAANFSNGAIITFTPGTVATIALQSTSGIGKWTFQFICPAYPGLHNLTRDWLPGQNNGFAIPMPAYAAGGAGATGPLAGIQLVSMVSDASGGAIPASIYEMQSTGGTAALSVRQVRVVTNAALSAYTNVSGVLTANANGALGSIDGVTVAVGDRVLLTLGAAGADNGIYQVTSLGGASAKFVLTLAPDWAQASLIQSGATVEVGGEGTAWPNSTWKATVAGVITVGTTDPAFFPRIQMGSGATGGGTTIALTTLWALSASTSHMFTQDRTAANATFIGTIVVGRGVGTATITGTTAHTIDWCLINW